MNKSQLLKKVAYLESLNDHLRTELTHVDRLMRAVGFNGGLEGIKITAQEIIDKGYQNQNQNFST